MVKSVCSLFDDLVSNAFYIMMTCWLRVIPNYKEYERKVVVVLYLDAGTSESHEESR